MCCKNYPHLDSAIFGELRNLQSSREPGGFFKWSNCLNCSMGCEEKGECFSEDMCSAFKLL